jgi:hypothetical protein
MRVPRKPSPRRKALDRKYARFGGLTGYVRFLRGKCMSMPDIAEKCGISVGSVHGYLTETNKEKPCPT